jgi:DNA-binding NtrC family response regulator/predicted hydrocarbon binding protein
MKAQDLRLQELLDFSAGELNFQGRRMVLHDIRAFAQLRNDLLDSLGPIPTRRILTRFGYFWGQEDAAAMKRLFNWDSLEEWLRAGSVMHTLQGVTRSVVQSLKVDAENKHLFMEVVWHNSGEAAEHLTTHDQAEEPVCWMLVGYASGYASFCLDKEVCFVETQCCAAGSAVCTAVGRDRESWGSDIEPHLIYFQKLGIHQKVIDLTEKLKQSEQKLIYQRQKLNLLEAKKQKASFFEVHSPAYEKVLELATRVAAYDSSLLITGESGVGKEVLARYIHRCSHRSQGPFVAVNCAALPETLLASELFGHKEGSFTGAVRNRRGLFEEANGGTILLDEIGDISLSLQVKLLRVLQEREIMRVGESQTRKVNIRVIAATNQNLLHAIGEGTFRDELYYRLRVIEIEIPPLRQRIEDVLPLSRYFVERFSKKFKKPNVRLDAKCLNYLQAYAWPGNIRELENAMERAVVLCAGKMILPEHLPPGIVFPDHAAHHTAFSPQRSLAEIEIEHIRQVLELTGGNKSRAVKILGISQATLWRKLKQP